MTNLVYRKMSFFGSTWTFVPNSPWRAGAYKLVARGTLEDPAGNRLGSHFETMTAVGHGGVGPELAEAV